MTLDLRRSPPPLLAVAHGSRDPVAGAQVAALLAEVRRRRPGLVAEASFIELAAPRWPEVLTATTGPAVVVPLLLAAGYHLRVDVRAAAGVRPGLVVAPPLGPHPLLAAVLADRLRQARTDDGHAVVLGVAGSTDPAGARDARRMAGWLTALLARPVRVGFLSAAEPSVAVAVAASRRAGARRVAVAAYLLAGGHFHRRLHGCGADAVTAPLAGHPLLARLLLARYDQAIRARPRRLNAAQAPGFSAPPWRPIGGLRA